MNAPSGAEGGVKETLRLEAFSDGVFAIAITLLILELKVPHAAELRRSGQRLTAALVQQWPSYLAYLTSFATILVMWVNHHRIFMHIHRINTLFLYLNGLLLLLVTFVPYPTAVLAEHIEEPGSGTAAAFFSGLFVVLAIVYNLLWGYASGGHRLLHRGASAAEVEAITKRYRVGPMMYLLAFGLSFVSVAASVGLCLALALFFAFTGSSAKEGAAFS